MIKKLVNKAKKYFYDAYWYLAMRYTLNVSSRLYNHFNGFPDLNPTVKADGLIFKMEAEETAYRYLDLNNTTKHYLMGHNSLIDNKIYVYFKNILKNSISEKNNTIDIKKLNVLIVITILHELSHSEQSGYDYLKWCENTKQSRDLLEAQNFYNYSDFILNNFDKINKVLKIDENLMRETLFKMELELNCKYAKFVPTLKKHRFIKGILIKSILSSNQNDDVLKEFLFLLDIAKNVSFIIDNKQYNVVVDNKETDDGIILKNKINRIINPLFTFNKDNSTIVINCSNNQ